MTALGAGAGIVIRTLAPVRGKIVLPLLSVPTEYMDVVEAQLQVLVDDAEASETAAAASATAAAASEVASEAAKTDAEAARDEAIDISNISTSDSAMATVINNPSTSGPLTGAALRAVFAPVITLTGAGIDLTGATDSTAALQALYAAGIAAGARRFVGVPGATYKVTMASNSQVFSITTDGVTFDLAESTIDNTAYTSTDDTIAPIFLVDGADDFTLILRQYLGYALPTPATHLGYRGATLVSAVNGAQGVRVRARASNLRYGVQTGSYGDATRGGCADFDIHLSGSMIGYPIALYQADRIRHDIDVNGVHRVAYVAGCDDVRGVARYSNQYIAPVSYLLSDALASGTDAAAQLDPVGAATTSRGCTNVKVKVIDKGSSTFVANSYVAGISLSRVDPGTTFSDIDVEVYVKGTNSLSTTVHGWSINSTANTIWNRYTYNWLSTILLQNIKVRGVVDKSACTVATYSGSNGFVCLRTDDPTAVAQTATIRNMVFEDLLVRSGTSGYVGLMYVRGLASPMIVNRLTIANAAGSTDGYLGLVGNTSEHVIFNGCKFGTIDTAVVTGTLYALGSGTSITAPDGDRTFRSEGGSLRSAGPRRQSKWITTSALSGASVTLSGAIPAGATDVRIQSRVTTALGGASGYQIGVSGDLTRYADKTGTAGGTVTNPATDHAASAYTTPSYGAATDLVITAKTSNFTSGVIRLLVSYTEYPSIAS